MDSKVSDGLQPLQKQLSTTITKLYRVANLPRIAVILRLGSLFVCLFITYTIFSDSSQRADYKQSFTSAVKGKKNVFVQSVLDNEIDGPFNNKKIVQLCAKTIWAPGIIFKCDAPEGGVGNVRNVFLNCLRYAIEAGASGFVVPEMFALTYGTKSSLVPFGHFFDLNHFTSSLSEACPQIHIYSHVNELYDIPSTSPPVPMVPTSFNHTALIDRHVLANPGNWSISFAQFVQKKHPIAPTAEKPILIAVAPSLLEFPLSYDDKRFVANFGRLLRFREDTRRIAAAVLYAMSQKHKLHLAFGQDEAITSSKFYGAHLRTGTDAMAAGWTSYAVQSANYLQEATQHALSVMYVASGSVDDVARLAASSPSISIETKESLLSQSPSAGLQPRPAKGFEREWAQMQTLNWDQQLLIDYEVLLRSSIFGGTWESSFSWNVAMRRHVLTGGGAWRVVTKRGDHSLVKENEGANTDRHPVSSNTVFTTPNAPSNQHRWKRAIATAEEQISRIFKRHAAAEDTPPQNSAPAEEGDEDEEEDEDDTEGEGIREANQSESSADEVKNEEGLQTEKPVTAVVVGEKAFSDGLSVVFGPAGVGKRIMSSMWP